MTISKVLDHNQKEEDSEDSSINYVKLYNEMNRLHFSACLNCGNSGHVAGNCDRYCKICLGKLHVPHHSFYDCPQYIRSNDEEKGKSNFHLPPSKSAYVHRNNLTGFYKSMGIISDERSLFPMKNTPFMKEILAIYQYLNSCGTEIGAIEDMMYTDLHMSSDQFEPTILDNCITKLDDINLVEFFKRFFNVGFGTSPRARYTTVQPILVLYLDDGKKLDKYTTTVDLRNAGTKLFDALLYSTDLINRNSLKLTEKGVDHSKYQDDIKKTELEALVYLYFYILIKGAFPENRPATFRNEREPPIFLTKVMKLTGDPFFYSNKLSTFDIAQLDPIWIRFIDLVNIGDGILKRINIYIASHTYLNIFKEFTPDNNNITREDVETYQELNRFAMMGPHWDAHPVTKSSEYCKFFNNSPDRQMAGLMKRFYSEKQINELINSGRVFSGLLVGGANWWGNFNAIYEEPFHIRFYELSKFESPIFNY